MLKKFPDGQNQVFIMASQSKGHIHKFQYVELFGILEFSLYSSYSSLSSSFKSSITACASGRT